MVITMKTHNVMRRTLLLLLAGTVALGLLAGCAAEPQPTLGRSGGTLGTAGGGGGGSENPPNTGGGTDTPGGGGGGGGSTGSDGWYECDALGFSFKPADGWLVVDESASSYIQVDAPENRGILFFELNSDVDTNWCRSNVDAVMGYITSSVNGTGYELVATDERNDLGVMSFFQISFMMTSASGSSVPVQTYITDDGRGGCYLNQFMNIDPTTSDFDDVDRMLGSFSPHNTGGA